MNHEINPETPQTKQAADGQAGATGGEVLPERSNERSQSGNDDVRPTPVVIVSRNTLALTKNAVRSVFSQNVPVMLMAIDNASTDGTADWLKTKTAATIFTGDQWSLARCWNLALRALWMCGFDRALVINSDVELRPDTVQMLTNHGGSFVTCVSVDDRERLGAAGDRDITALRDGERPHPDFSCFLIRREVTDKGIWFNEDCYPAYVEDSFFHVAMHDAGIDAVCIDLPFYHEGAATLKQCSDGEAARIRRGADRNRELFRKRYGCLPGSDGYGRLFL